MSASMIIQYSFGFIVHFWILTNGKAEDVKGAFILLAKGHRLKVSLIKEIQADSAIHCIQQCLNEGSHCLSINYGRNSYAEGKCQLNERAAVGEVEVDLIMDKDFDYFERDTVRQQCLPTPPASSPKSAIRLKPDKTQEYIMSRGAPAMKAMSICLWIRTDQSSGEGNYVSYAVEGCDNEFLMYSQWNLKIWLLAPTSGHKPSSKSHDIRIKDGKWHHICVTWESQRAAYQIYKDGAIAGNGTIDEIANRTIRGGGTWVLGQDQDEVGGGFQASQRMHGDIAYCNVWSYVLSPTEIFEMSKRCEGCSKGNVKTWDDFLLGIMGNAETIEATCN